MVTKGIITSIDFNGNTCQVRIPLFETAGNDPITGTAIVSNTPGSYNGYKVGDVVLVAFEDGKMQNPVIVGKLYLGAAKEKQDPRGTINVETTTASKSASLPADAVLTANVDSNVPNTNAPFGSLASIANNLNSLNTDVNQLDKFTRNQFNSVITDVNDQGEQLRSEIKQTAENIEANVVHKHQDGSQNALGWDLDVKEWKINAQDTVNGEVKDINIVTIDRSGMSIAGDLKLNGYPKNIIVKYVQNDSDTTHPALDSTEWSTNVPARVDGQYIWQWTHTESFSFNGDEWTEQDDDKVVCITGADGKAGAPGKNGADGKDGYTTVTVMLYKRSKTSVSDNPISDELYYKFSDQKLYTNEGCTTEYTLPAGWSYTISDAGDSSNGDLYCIAAVANSNTDSDSIPASEWAGPTLYVENGVSGTSVAQLTLYQRAASTPNNPTKDGTWTYNAADGSLTCNNEATAWKTSIPSGTDPCYESHAAVLVTGLGTATVTKWSEPAKFVENGADGTDGISIKEVKQWYILWSASTSTNPTKPANNTEPTEPATPSTVESWMSTPPEAVNDYVVWTCYGSIFSDDTTEHRHIEYSDPVKDNAYALAQGKTTNYYSDTDPADVYSVKKGDCWFKTISSTNDEYNNEMPEQNQGKLYQCSGFDTNGKAIWEDVGGELVANKLTANYINALDITAKKITVLNNNNATQSDSNPILFEANGLSGTGSVKIANFTVNQTGLYSGEHNEIGSTKDGVYLGADGISIGSNFKITAGNVIISDYTKSTIKKYRKIEYDNETEAAAKYTDWDNWDSSNWLSKIPNRENGKYIWEWTKEVKGNSTDDNSTWEDKGKICITGAKGDPGSPGSPGPAGATPYVQNGNWWIGDKDTGIKAEGTDGHTPVITIGENGNWYIDGKDTGVLAKGTPGEPGAQGIGISECKTYYSLSNTTSPTGPTTVDNNGNENITSTPAVNKWSASPQAFNKNDHQGYSYWTVERRVYTNNAIVWGTPVKASMLSTDFIDSLGITAKKITVLQDNSVEGSAENPILFQADGINGKGEVKIGGFTVDSNRLYAGTPGSGSGIELSSYLTNLIAYKSNNQGIDSSYAVSKITINKATDLLTVYIRSYAESGWDYIMISKPNASSYPMDYSSDSVEAHTYANPNSGSTLADYTKVEYYGLKQNDCIYVAYVKDESNSVGADTGYFLIPETADVSISNVVTYHFVRDSAFDIKYAHAAASIKVGTNFSVDGAGAIKSTRGTIGGFTIGNNANSSGTTGGPYIKYGNEFADNSIWLSPGYKTVKQSLTGDTNIRTWTVTSGQNFGVTSNGDLYANNAHIKGDLRTTGYNIGDNTGIWISSAGVTSTTSVGGSPSGTSNTWTIASGDDFGVTSDGKIFTRYGKIGALDLTPTTLSAGQRFPDSGNTSFLHINTEKNYAPTGWNDRAEDATSTLEASSARFNVQILGIESDGSEGDTVIYMDGRHYADNGLVSVYQTQSSAQDNYQVRSRIPITEFENLPISIGGDASPYIIPGPKNWNNKGYAPVRIILSGERLDPETDKWYDMSRICSTYGIIIIDGVATSTIAKASNTSLSGYSQVATAYYENHDLSEFKRGKLTSTSQIPYSSLWIGNDGDGGRVSKISFIITGWAVSKSLE